MQPTLCMCYQQPSTETKPPGRKINEYHFLQHGTCVQLTVENAHARTVTITSLLEFALKDQRCIGNKQPRYFNCVFLNRMAGC